MTGLDVYNKLLGYGVPAEHARILAAVAYPESGYNPKAELKTSREDSVGLFQINMYAHGDKLAQWTGSRDINVWRTWLQNPENNIYAAAQVYKSQGLGAWTAYTKGLYVPYLYRLSSLTVKGGGGQGGPYLAGGQGQTAGQGGGPVLSPVALAGGAVILALVLAAGVAMMAAGGLRSA
jgi:hypothetical protein